MHIRRYLVVAALSGLLSLLVGGVFAELPSSHPIHTLPDIRIGNVEDALQKKFATQWSFSLDKPGFFVGEPITGTVTVSNRDRAAISFSPPMQSQFVATLSVWVRLAGEQADEDAGLRQISYINKGNYRNRSEQFQGKPATLDPGDSAQFPVLLNVVQFALPGGGSTWGPEPGFSAPGQYEVFLQYGNLEDVLPYASRGAERALTAVDNTKPAPIPFSPPIVLGPFKLTIHPLADADEQTAVETVLKAVELHAADQRHGAGDMCRHAACRGYLAEMDEVPHSLDPDHPELNVLRASWAFGKMRHRLTRLLVSRPGPGALDPILADLESLSRLTLPKPFVQSLAVTRCEALAANGNMDQAVAELKAVAHPDGAVLLESWMTSER